MLDTYEIPVDLMERHRVAERISSGSKEYIAMLRAQRSPVRVETALARQNLEAAADKLIMGIRLELIDYIEVQQPTWFEIFVAWGDGSLRVATNPFDALIGEMTLSPGTECILRSQDTIN